MQSRFVSRVAWSIATVLLLVSASSVALARENPWLIGKIVYTAPVVVIIDPLAGVPITERYYVGEYACYGGSEHFAPTCVKDEKAYEQQSPAKISIHLADGAEISIDPNGAPDVLGPFGVFGTLVSSWMISYGFHPPAEQLFRYRLGKFHKGSGLQDVEVALPASESLSPSRGAYKPGVKQVAQ